MLADADRSEDTVMPTLCERIEDGMRAEYEAEERIAEILGAELLGVAYDPYDNSLEIYPMPDAAISVPLTSDEHLAIIDGTGCNCYWINFPDGLESYCGGIRREVEGNRWSDYDEGCQRKRGQR